MKGDKLTCGKCQHTWITRVDRKPVQCPKCKNTDWINPLVYQVRRVRDGKAHQDANNKDIDSIAREGQLRVGLQ